MPDYLQMSYSGHNRAQIRGIFRRFHTIAKWRLIQNSGTLPRFSIPVFLPDPLKPTLNGGKLVAEDEANDRS